MRACPRLPGDGAATTPDWFRAAIDTPGQAHNLMVGGARICYRAWGRPRDPGVVLVHGSAANARWWDHIAPQLADGRHVVAIDLSGHGDSQWRDSYQQAVWADELRAVVR